MNVRRLFAVVLPASLALAAQPAIATKCERADNETYAQGRRHCLAIATARPRVESDTVVVTLHGSMSRGGTIDGWVRFGERLAEEGFIAVTVMQPGYTGAGRTSSGVALRDRNSRKRFWKREIDSIGAGIERIKAHHGAKRLILVGHSAGAVVSGVLVGRYPDLADAAVLVSGPCNHPKWRQSHGRPPRGTAQSPHRYLKKIDSETRIVALTGSEDSNTFPSNCRRYIEKANKRGLDARFVLVDGAGHGFDRRLRRVVLEALDELVAD